MSGIVPVMPWALLLLAGCYASHERISAGTDAGRGDSRPPVRDSAIRPDVRPLESDSAVHVDAAPVERCDENTRPSELSIASRWVDVDPALFDPADPPGTMSDPVALGDDPSSAEGAPSLAASASALFFAWPGLVGVASAASLEPGRSGYLRVPEPTVRAAYGRFAIAGGWGSLPASLAVVNEAAPVPSDFLEWKGASPDPAWLECTRSWAVGYSSVGASAVLTRTADELARTLGDETILAADDVVSLRTVGLASRAAVVWIAGSAVRLALSSGGSVIEVMPFPATPDSDLEAARARDRVAVAVMDGAGPRVALVDPWAAVVAIPPFSLGTSGITDRRPGLAVAEERGYLGACWAEGRGPAGGSGRDRVRFAMRSLEGEVLGRTLVVAPEQENVGGCAVAWTGEAFIVAWWRAGGDHEHNAVFARRIVPLA